MLPTTFVDKGGGVSKADTVLYRKRVEYKKKYQKFDNDIYRKNRSQMLTEIFKCKF